MSDYLPLDIVEQVLFRLPIKSLLCCSAICKAWYDIINTSEFVSAHFEFTKSLPSSTYLVIEDYCTDENKYFYVLFSDDEAGTFKEYTRFKVPDEKSRNFHAVGSSCNGLICLAKTNPFYTDDHAQDIFIWNPMIQWSLHLPKPDTETRFHEAWKDIEDSNTFGFVFDRTANDYKVLRVCSGDGYCPSIVQVFKLSTGLWEDISYKAPFRYIFLDSLQADLRGIAHWLGSDNNGKSKIVTFDVHEEVFGSIELPVIVLNDDETYPPLIFEKYLFAFEGSLFFIRYVDAPEKHKFKFDMWKMEGYNEVESWTQVHTWDFVISVRPLGFRKNGEILWVAEEGMGQLISTNLADASINYFGVSPNASSIGVSRLDYVESLILLDKSFTKWS